MDLDYAACGAVLISTAAGSHVAGRACMEACEWMSGSVRVENDAGLVSSHRHPDIEHQPYALWLR